MSDKDVLFHVRKSIDIVRTNTF